MLRSSLTRVLFSLSLLAAVSSTVSDDLLASDWKPIGLQSIPILALASAPDRICAGSLGEGVFCLNLDQTGAAWNSVGPAPTSIASVWIAPHDPQIVLVAIANAISPSILIYIELPARWHGR